MKLETHIKLNEVSIKELLTAVLLLQIALWVVIGLRALGVSIPIVQPLIGIIYLTFVPGILILTALKLRSLDIVEIALYAVGLSVAIVLSIGLVLTVVFNAFQIVKPFSLLAVTGSLSFLVLLLCAVAYYRNRTLPKPLFNTKTSIPLIPTLFLCLLPFITVFCTYLVNVYNINAGQFFLLAMLSVVALLIAFDKVIPSKLYPLAVFVVALSILFQRTLISAWISGPDIQTEWSLAHFILNTGAWNLNLPHQYDAMLSIVSLAPIYSLISSFDLIWVFKLVYPAIFALVPVGLYQIFHRQLNDKVAFLSCFFFVSIAGFYNEMPGMARQEVAELFCVLLILLLVSEEMNQGIKAGLFTVFGLSMVVSHYGVTYLFLIFFFVTWLLLTVTRVDRSKQMPRSLWAKFGILRDKQVTAASPKPPARSALTFVSISVLFIASTAWYFYAAQGSIPQHVVALVNHIATSIGELYNPTYSQAANVIEKGPLPGVLHRVNAYVSYLNVFFILSGVCLTIFLKKQRYKLQFSYLVLSTVTLGFLIASVIVPWLAAALNYSRVYHIALIILAPFLIIGFVSIGETAGVIIRRVISKREFGSSARVNRSYVLRLLAIYLVLCLWLSTGYIFALAESKQQFELTNQGDGWVHNQEIVGLTWQADNIDNGAIPLPSKLVTIFHYFNNVRYIDTTAKTNSDGQITLTQTFDSAGPYAYYATFAGDGSYASATSAVVNIDVGSNQRSNQVTTNVDSVTTTTLVASTTTPAVGQPVTFTASLTGKRIVYGDYYTSPILNAFEPERGQELPPPQNVSDFYIFLTSYNLKHNKALIQNYVGVNKQPYYQSIAPLVSNKSLIYSSGAASVYL